MPCFLPPSNGKSAGKPREDAGYLTVEKIKIY
jgi:hypothetical protein